MNTEINPRYRVTQKGVTINIPVTDLDSLVTHHPGDNQNGRIVDGVPRGVQDPIGRSYGIVGAELQELEMRSTDGPGSPLAQHQVLLVKDLILEDSRTSPGGLGARDVDVPSPLAGYISRVSARAGLVEIRDREGGEVIARIRHMRPIHVHEGDVIEYGQALGVQSDQATEKKHLHVEIDTKYYQHFDNYVADLTNGRLTIDPDRLTHGIPPLPVFDDGTLRVGEANPIVREFQEVLIESNYRGARGLPINGDGVYRLEMQPAVLAYQRDHGLAQTGDIDRATLHVALPLSRDRAIDRMDHVERSLAPFAPTLEPDMPVHGYRPGPGDYRRHSSRREPFSFEGQIPVSESNQQTRGPFNDPYLDRAYAAAINGNSAELDRIGLEFTQSQEGQRMLQWGQELYAQQQWEQQRQLQEQQMAQERQGPVMTR